VRDSKTKRIAESKKLTIDDFTNANHNHSNVRGGGQLNDTALSTQVTVPKGGTGLTTLTADSIMVGNGADAVSLKELLGTTDQITVTIAASSITLALPQDIATGSSPLFNLVKQTAPYHAYGGFQSEAETISIAAVDTWTWVTNGTNDLWTGLESAGMSVSGDILTITNAGHYAGTLSMTFYGLATKDFEIRVYNITQTRQEAYVQGATTTGANNYTNVALPLFIEAEAGDQFRIEVQCITDGSDPTFEHAVFYLSYLHE